MGSPPSCVEGPHAAGRRRPGVPVDAALVRPRLARPVRLRPHRARNWRSAMPNANPAPDDAALTEVLQMGIADAKEALRLARRNAASWRIDPARVGIMGFSAGGGVAVGTALAERSDASPDFLISALRAVAAGRRPAGTRAAALHRRWCHALQRHQWLSRPVCRLEGGGEAGGNPRLRPGERWLRDVAPWPAGRFLDRAVSSTGWWRGRLWRDSLRAARRRAC